MPKEIDQNIGISTGASLLTDRDVAMGDIRHGLNRVHAFAAKMLDV